MVRFLLILMVLIAAVVVQTTLADLAAVGDARPDFLLAAAVFFALHYDLRQAIFPIWGLGVFRDAFSLGPIGMYALLFLLVGLAVSYVRTIAFRDNPFIAVATAVGSVMLCELLAGAALSAAFRMPGAGRIATLAVLSAAYSSIIVLVLPKVLTRPCQWAGLAKK